MSNVKANARMQYESKLRIMKAATGEVRNQLYFNLQGYIHGMYWSDLITDEEYFALDDEAFEAWTSREVDDVTD